MAEIDGAFVEMLATLRDARRSVKSEIRALRQTTPINRRALVLLDDSVRNFAAQADAVILTLVETYAADDLVDAAEDPADFLRTLGSRSRPCLWWA